MKRKKREFKEMWDFIELIKIYKMGIAGREKEEGTEKNIQEQMLKKPP